jgi:subfamily B ATP-binding cassette protein MsbA
MEAIDAIFLIIVHVCRIAVFGFLMAFISWQLTAMVVTLGLAANLLVARPLFRLVHRLGEREVSVRSEISQRVLRALGGMRVIRAFGQEDREYARFRVISEQARTLLFRITQAQQLLPVALETVYAPVFLAVVLTASIAKIGVPMLLAYLLLFYRVQPDIKQLDSHRAYLAGLTGSLHEIAALLERSSKSAIRSGFVAFDHLQDRITFDKVSFRYRSAPERAVTLTDVSFELRAGKTTAIVGESGAGKTTLINLLFGFYQPIEGQIRVDGRPLASLRTDLWREKLGLAGQDVGLLEGTIRENIVYGCPYATSDEIEEAARLAAIHDFIRKLPRGYETGVGESGLQLSQGQRQRISLARALLRRPEILILDEATNALDGLTEEVIHQTLDRFAGKMTVVIIAHRLSTVRLADCVIVLNAGTVVETGTFKELLARPGTFARLFATQAPIVSSLSK